MTLFLLDFALPCHQAAHRLRWHFSYRLDSDSCITWTSSMLSQVEDQHEAVYCTQDERRKGRPYREGTRDCAPEPGRTPVPIRVCSLEYSFTSLTYLA